MNQIDEAVQDAPPEAREAIKQMTNYWWLWLVFGIVWIIVALVILQSDSRSTDVVGLIIGAMFVGAGIQYMVISTLMAKWRWVWLLLGALLIVFGVVSIFNPAETFNDFASIVGFLFLLVAFTWIIQAFAERDHNDLWWLGLVSGVLMLVIAFWTSGQLFNTKAHLLIVFAGLWALMAGLVDIVRGFQLHAVGQRLK